jgi:hypothetical protein
MENIRVNCHDNYELVDKKETYKGFLEELQKVFKGQETGEIPHNIEARYFNHPNTTLSMENFKTHFIDKFNDIIELRMELKKGKFDWSKKIKHIICVDNSIERPFVLTEGEDSFKVIFQNNGTDILKDDEVLFYYGKQRLQTKTAKFIDKMELEQIRDIDIQLFSKYIEKFPLNKVIPLTFQLKDNKIETSFYIKRTE